MQSLYPHAVDLYGGKTVMPVQFQKHPGKLFMVTETAGVTRRTPQTEFHPGFFCRPGKGGKALRQPVTIHLPEIHGHCQIVAGQFVETFAFLP